MSEPVTLDHFKQFEKRFDDFVELYTTNHANVVARLDQVADVAAMREMLADLVNRVARLETITRR